MTALDNHDYDTAHRPYEAEAKRRWGNTAAYGEYEQKAIAADAARGLMELFGAFAACRAEGNVPHSAAAQALVERLQAYITVHFYTCTDEILAGLGQMYAGDERFKATIDRYGEGTADFISAAIKVYCDN